MRHPISHDDGETVNALSLDVQCEYDTVNSDFKLSNRDRRTAILIIFTINQKIISKHAINCMTCGQNG